MIQENHRVWLLKNCPIKVGCSAPKVEGEPLVFNNLAFNDQSDTGINSQDG